LIKILDEIRKCRNNLSISPIAEDWSVVESDEMLTDTEKVELKQCRIGQGKFRVKVIKYWGEKCAITGCKNLDVLIASHIKPWRESSNRERLDCKNGILLAAHYDRLFDRGYITFESSGIMKVSKRFNHSDQSRLGIGKTRLGIKIMDKTQKQYLEFHRKNIFLK